MDSAVKYAKYEKNPRSGDVQPVDLLRRVQVEHHGAARKGFSGCQKGWRRAVVIDEQTRRA
jgi:hypothetical protein